MDRRRFLQCLVIAGTIPAFSVMTRAETSPLGALRIDSRLLLDLPEGFRYDIVSRAGTLMDDGLRVPHAHDGMAAFAGENGRIVLVCNHELAPTDFEQSAFGPSFHDVPADIKLKLYDLGGGNSPGAGGTTTTVYNPSSGEVERQHLSLGGTEYNCAGGPTPWGSWLSCEECVESPGVGWSLSSLVRREKAHGYVFEVPVKGTGLAEPVPLREMGRFMHEAAAVHDPTGIVYMTEDRHHSLFYRFIPNEPGNLAAGGNLQALAIDGPVPDATHNWSRETGVRIGEPLPTRWMTLDDVDSDEDTLRKRGAEAGAATFARGEGLCVAGENFVFACTTGGPARLGQLFSYSPSPHEGTPAENESPGYLTLIAEATEDSLLRHADNLTMAPWGDLIVCEDTAEHCGLVGVRPDGSQYAIADNSHSDSELAGVCFSPDGKTLFVNIQYPGTTLAITGPWPT